MALFIRTPSTTNKIRLASNPRITGLPPPPCERWMRIPGASLSNSALVLGTIDAISRSERIATCLDTRFFSSVVRLTDSTISPRRWVSGYREICFDSWAFDTTTIRLSYPICSKNTSSSAEKTDKSSCPSASLVALFFMGAS